MENREGENVKKRTKIMLGILLTLAAVGLGYCVYKYWEAVKLEYCELTEKELEFLNMYSYYYGIPDVQRFRTGMLYKDEIRQIGWLRRVYADLEERYPGYQFYISGKRAPGMFGQVGYSIYYTEEETTGREFDTHVYFKDGDYDYEKDNFYSYFVEEEYAAYVKELLEKKRVADVVKVDCSMSCVEGKEYNSEMCLEDIVSGKLDVLPSVQMYLCAGDKTEEECKEYGEIIQQKIETSIPKGHYGVYFCDMSESEEQFLEDEMKFIYIHIW